MKSMQLPALLGMITICGGCCVRVAAEIRNQSGRDVVLTINRPPAAPAMVPIAAGARKVVDGVMPSDDPQRQQTWQIQIADRRIVFSDLSPIASLPDRYVSISRFTSDFPCERVTRHVRLTPDLTIQAEPRIEPTSPQPPGFPIHPAQEDSQ